MLQRCKLIGLSLGIGLGAFSLGNLTAFIGGQLKHPWKPVVPTAKGVKAVSSTSGWTQRFSGETIYLARPTGSTDHARLVNIGPADINAGGVKTMVGWRESDGDDTTVEPDEKLSEIARSSRNPLMPSASAHRHAPRGHAPGPEELHL